MNCRSIGLFIVVLTSVGCSEDRKASAAPVNAAKMAADPPRATVLPVPTTPYRVVSVPAGGTITGTVDAGRDPLPETFNATVAPQTGCAPPLPRNDVRAGSRLSGAVVWITNLRAGRGFPMARRYELTNDECVLTPRVVPLFVSATLNVGTNDAAMHNHRFVNVATGETEGVAPFNDSGEVIPFDRLFRKTAQYEVTCEFHPWSQAWILVFDHPYYVQTGADGSFSLQGVPPGNYQVRAWHPSYGVSDGSVTVGAGQTAAIVMRVGGAGQLPVAAPSVSPAAASTPAASKS